MKCFDIVLVDFPFSDMTKSKLRPALVVSVPGGDNIILCQITTKKRNIKNYEVCLEKNKCSGNIKFNSYIYIDMIFTLHNSLIYKKIGFIKDNKTKENINFIFKKLFNNN
ncbi:MAG: type II toxin-antitoxin system PemK/MazF family toxin [Nanobdellota archaeon]